MKFARCLLLLTFALCGTARAQLRWESRNLEFHPSASDTEVIADFHFTNTGKHPVKIKGVRTSCGCTTASMEKEVYAPGEKGTITATFDIGGRVGVQEKKVYVSTDDSRDELVLAFKATIPQILDVEPIFLNWAKGEPLKPKTAEVKVMNGFPVNHLTVTSSSLNMAVEVKHTEGSRTYQIIATPKKTDDGVAASIEICPDFPKNPPKYFHIYTSVEN